MPHIPLIFIVVLLCAGQALAELRPLPRHIPFVDEDPIELDLTGRPAARQSALPRARWEYRGEGPLWSRVALSAVQTHGAALLELVPRDIADWCPAYPENDRENRAAFWVALISTLARYESTWNPRAVGGGRTLVWSDADLPADCRIPGLPCAKRPGVEGRCRKSELCHPDNGDYCPA